MDRMEYAIIGGLFQEDLNLNIFKDLIIFLLNKCIVLPNPIKKINLVNKKSTRFMETVYFLIT